MQYFNSFLNKSRSIPKEERVVTVKFIYTKKWQFCLLLFISKYRIIVDIFQTKYSLRIRSITCFNFLCLFLSVFSPSPNPSLFYLYCVSRNIPFDLPLTLFLLSDIPPSHICLCKEVCILWLSLNNVKILEFLVSWIQQLSTVVYPSRIWDDATFIENYSFFIKNRCSSSLWFGNIK